MELHDAMEQISEIRLRLAQAETFRGYRAATVAFTGAVAFAAAAIQGIVLPDPTANPGAYVTLWVAAAALAGAVAAGEMSYRCRQTSARLSRSVTRLAVEQFLPCLVAGGLLTAVLTVYAEESLWMLPGLWQLLFSLGVFASCRLLPRATVWVGAFYLVAGLACLAMARGPSAFVPWAMGLPFGCGQLLTAAILYWYLERPHGDR